MQGARASVPTYLYRKNISGIQESEFQEGKKIRNLVAGYFWSFIVFFFVGYFVKRHFLKFGVPLIFMGEGLNYFKFIHL